jgi:hypothetical protein
MMFGWDCQGMKACFIGLRSSGGWFPSCSAIASSNWSSYSSTSMLSLASEEWSAQFLNQVEG